MFEQSIMNTYCKTKCSAVLAAGIAAYLAASGNANAQSSDALIDKLVDKGILTVKEANDLREEADKGFNSAFAVKSGMPDWVTSLKINGDMRGRYEAFDYPINDGGLVKNATVDDRNRFRYRARLGFVAVLKDNFEVGLRLSSSEPVTGGSASGGGDPISGNTTFSNNGSKKFIYVDLAYAKWTPVNNSLWSATTTFGKMENPFVYSDMVFDADYTPEGIAQQFSYNVSDQHVLKANLGAFVLNEVGGSSTDTYMGGAQLRLDSTWTPKLATSAGVGILAINGTSQLLGASVPDQNSGNVRQGGGAAAVSAPIYNFNPITADLSATYNLASFPMYAGAFPIKIFGDFMFNPAAHDLASTDIRGQQSADNQAYQFGVTLGKSGKKGTWDLTWRYKVLEANAWFEELVDSDFGAFYQRSPTGSLLSNAGNNVGSYGYRAGTNVRGHIVKATYSPYDSLTFGVTYFLTELINEAANTGSSQAGRLQVDMVLKF